MATNSLLSHVAHPRLCDNATNAFSCDKPCDKSATDGH